MRLYTILLLCFFSFQNTNTAQDIIEENDSLIPPRLKLTVALKESPPFTYKNKNGDFMGISVFLWDKIANELEVDFEYKEMSLPEILSGLEGGSVDLSINPLTVTSSRIKHMTFSQPFFISNSVIVTQERQKDRIQNVIYQFFSLGFLKALFFLMVALVSFGTVIWLFERKKNPLFSNGIFGWWTGIWWSAATMTTVGYGDVTPKGFWGQLIGMVLMFVALIVVTGLMAGITSALTVNQMNDDWTHVQDLRKTKAGTIEQSASHQFLDHNLIKTTKVPTVTQGLEDVSSGKLDAFVYDEPILRWQIENDSFYDKVRVLPFTFNTQYYSFASPKNDTLIQRINPILLDILETVEWRAVLSDYQLHGI